MIFIKRWIRYWISANRLFLFCFILLTFNFETWRERDKLRDWAYVCVLTIHVYGSITFACMHANLCSFLNRSDRLMLTIFRIFCYNFWDILSLFEPGANWYTKPAPLICLSLLPQQCEYRWQEITVLQKHKLFHACLARHFAIQT